MFQSDLQAFALFRIVFAVYLLCDFFIGQWPYYSDFYGTAGIVPTYVLDSESFRPGLVFMLPLVRFFESARMDTVLPFAYPLAIALFGIGYRTRVAAAIAYVFNSYLFWRNPYVRSGADDLSHLLLLWCLFIPVDRFWSVDAALTKEERSRSTSLVPTLAIRAQVASVYVFAGLFKLYGEPWRKGLGAAYAMSDQLYGATPLSNWLLAHLPATIIAVNYLIIAFQLAFPLLIYCPWHNARIRGFAICGAAIMHLSFIFCLNIGSFPYLSLVMLLLLVPDQWIDRALAARRRRLALATIYFEPGCEFCSRVSLLLKGFFLSTGSRVLPASRDPKIHELLRSHNSWVVKGHDGKLYLKWDAMAYLLKQNLLTSPIANGLDYEFFKRRFDRVYDWVGWNRARLAPVALAALSTREHVRGGYGAIAVCAILAVLALAANVTSVARQEEIYRSTFMNNLFAVAQVRQHWDLFAPNPTHFAWQFSIRRRTAEGEREWVSSNSAPISIGRATGEYRFVASRWRKFFSWFGEFSHAQWNATGEYFCLRIGKQSRPSDAQEIMLDFAKVPLSSLQDDAKITSRRWKTVCPVKTPRPGFSAGKQF